MSENMQNNGGIIALEFISELENPPFDFSWNIIAERVNKNMNWLLENDDWDDENTWLADKLKSMLDNRSENVKVLKSWLTPRLKYEETNRESTFPTSIVLQIIGLLDRNLLMEIIAERISIIGNDNINSSDEDYYYKLEIMEKTFDPIIATLFRRAYGCNSRKENSTNDTLADYHDLYLNEQKDEFEAIWQIIGKNMLFDYSITNTVSKIIDGSIQRKSGICGSDFIEFLSNLSPESNNKIEDFRNAIIENNRKVIKEIEEQYGYY